MPALRKQPEVSPYSFTLYKVHKFTSVLLTQNIKNKMKIELTIMVGKNLKLAVNTFLLISYCLSMASTICKMFILEGV